jgi:hypothetical protein
LHSYGIHKDQINWIEAFLVNRRQRVKINGKISNWKTVTSGIPQGSILGPLLFVIFINDIVESCSGGSDIYLYADDAKIFKHITNNEDCKGLQDDINRVKDWSDKWLLKLNETKCKVISYGGIIRHQNQYHIMSNQSQYVLQRINSISDLGVIFDENLKFDKHICEKIKKAYSILGIIKRNFRCLSQDSFIQLYKTLVRPLLEYANVVWSPYRQKYIEMIEKVQMRATKIILSNKNLTYYDRLKILNLPTMVYRRHRGDMIETFKIINDCYDKNCTLHLRLSHMTVTRGHRFKLAHTYSHLDKRRYFFSNRIVNLWNNLPDHVVYAQSINSFKNNLDKFWSSQHCLYDWKSAITGTGDNKVNSLETLK